MPISSSSIIRPQSTERAAFVPVPITDVTMKDGFWKRWMEANRTKGIPALHKQLEKHGVVNNFRLVSGRAKGERQGPYFTDSDLYKWMEGAALALASGPDEELEKLLETVIAEVGAAQRPDGYVNTFFTGDIADERFRNLGSEHELYCAGHMFQAAVAHYRVTGRTNFLDIATRFADHLVNEFGPGRIEQPDGHPEVEMALIELYRTTGNQSYLDLAGFFLDRQDYGRQGQISGHAVRAAYLVAGAADYYLETGRREARQAAESLWQDMSTGRMYITGGLGARHEGEAIGDRFELPNESAYAETCAAIANAMWNFRMLVYSGDARYADIMETALYNNVLSGISLDTTAWFYVNPLANFKEFQRQDWWGCTCCPTNVVRTLASIPGYMYGASDSGIWVNLYDASSASIRLPVVGAVRVDQQTAYPWDGSVQIVVTPESEQEFSLHLRIPGWCKSAQATVNGQPAASGAPGTYLKIKRSWKPGDRVKLELASPVEFVVASRKVKSNIGHVALRKGPVVYCFESNDNPSVDLRTVQIRQSRVRSEMKAGLLGGITVLEAEGTVPAVEEEPLYQTLDVRKESGSSPKQLTAIPYFAWANRGNSHMIVWLPLAP